jgi:hypothetical protein
MKKDKMNSTCSMHGFMLHAHNMFSETRTYLTPVILKQYVVIIMNLRYLMYTFVTGFISGEVSIQCSFRHGIYSNIPYKLTVYIQILRVNVKYSRRTLVSWLCK